MTSGLMFRCHVSDRSIRFQSRRIYVPAFINLVVMRLPRVSMQAFLGLAHKEKVELPYGLGFR